MVSLFGARIIFQRTKYLLPFGVWYKTVQQSPQLHQSKLLNCDPHNINQKSQNGRDKIVCNPQLSILYSFIRKSLQQNQLRMFFSVHYLDGAGNLSLFSLTTTVLSSSRSPPLVRSTDNTPGSELPLSSSCPLFLFFRFCGEAVWAWDTVFPLWRFHVFVAHRLLATIAKFKASLNQSMINRNPFVKNKAFPLPEALIFRDFLQVF